MSKERKPAREPEREAAEYYRLNTRAVEELVTANEENSPPVSREELRKYSSRGRLRLAEWVKLLLIKWWFAAAVCFFFLWGLGTAVPNLLDLMVITAVALGFVTDLLTNNALRFVTKTKGGADRWMMHPRKGYVSLPLNVLHSCAVMFLVYTAYNAMNRAWIAMNGLAADAVPLGVEPIGFGLLCLAADLLLIGMKHGLERIVADAKKNAGGARGSRNG